MQSVSDDRSTTLLAMRTSRTDERLMRAVSVTKDRRTELHLTCLTFLTVLSSTSLRFSRRTCSRREHRAFDHFTSLTALTSQCDSLLLLMLESAMTLSLTLLRLMELLLLLPLLLACSVILMSFERRMRVDGVRCSNEQDWTLERSIVGYDSHLSGMTVRSLTFDRLARGMLDMFSINYGVLSNCGD